MFYNPERKETFKNYCLETGVYKLSTLKTPVRALFNCTAKYEKRLDKDVAELSSNQVEELLQFLSNSYKTRKSLSSVCSYLYTYYHWSMIKGFSKSDTNLFDKARINKVIEEVIPDSVNSKNFFSKGQLQRYINDITDVTCKFIAYAFFFNIKGDEEYNELTHIKMSDLNENDKRIHLCTNRDVEIDDFFIYLMKQANSATYYDEDGSYTPNKAGIYDYVPSDYVLKQMSFSGGLSEPLTKSMMNKKVGTIKRQCSQGNMCHATASYNGLVYFIQKKYNGNGISLERAILTDKPDGKMYTHDRETENYIHEFGLNKEVRSLRREIRPYIDNYLENEIEDIKDNVSAIPDIRIVDLKRANSKTDDVQNEIILGDILESEQCIYKHEKYNLKWDNNTLILFSNNDYIIACGKLNHLIKTEKGLNGMCFFPESIQVFSPFTLEELKNTYPQFVFFKNELFQKPSVKDITDLYSMIYLKTENYNLAQQCEKVAEKVAEETARKLDINELLNRIENGRKSLYYRNRTASVRHHRDLYLKELIKRLAEGRCQLCEQLAPFKDINRVPYLEEHHVVRLADGGKDILENVVAICPNCHRKAHILKHDKDIMRLNFIAKNNIELLEKKRK